MRIAIVQEIIDVLRGKTFGLDTMVNKHECFLNIKDYYLLAFGSSHMDLGYIPAEGEINMGSPSQDLYYSYNLYKLMNNETLKVVLQTYSAFSAGDVLIKSRYNKLAVMFKLLYNIPYQDNEIAKKLHFNFWEKYYKFMMLKYLKVLNLPQNYNGKPGCNNTIGIKDEAEIQKRALKHYKIGKKSTQIDYCKKLLKETKNNNQKIYFILPPVTSYYKAILPASGIIFNELYEVCKGYSHAEILNFYDSDFFTDDDFSDGDHLNYGGATKLTQKVKERFKIY
ncbi:hypothetical protein J6E39_06875 [bacterium]|nr:hypothetical protein [bacterium]